VAGAVFSRARVTKVTWASGHMLLSRRPSASIFLKNGFVKKKFDLHHKKNDRCLLRGCLGLGVRVIQFFRVG
jgi:hypothetical protein